MKIIIPKPEKIIKMKMKQPRMTQNRLSEIVWVIAIF